MNAYYNNNDLRQDNINTLYQPAAVQKAKKKSGGRIVAMALCFSLLGGAVGTGGTYLGFISGNLANLKVPCAMNARDIAGTEVGTDENEVISTIAIASSTIVTTLVIAAGVLLIVPLTPLLENPVLQPAFKTVVSALFGAMGFVYIRKYPKIAIIPWILAAVIFWLVPSLTSMVSIMVVVLAVISMAIGHLLYKGGKI